MKPLNKIKNVIVFIIKMLLDFKYDSIIIVRWLQGTKTYKYYNHITNLEVLSIFIDLILISIDPLLFSNLETKYKILLFSLFFISFDLFQSVAYETINKSNVKHKKIRKEIINITKGFGNYIAAIILSCSIFGIFKRIKYSVREMEIICQQNIHNIIIQLLFDLIIVFIICCIYPKTKEIKPKSYRFMRHTFIYALLSLVLNLNFIALITLLIYLFYYFI